MLTVGKVLGISKIREKGQITIPKAVRDYLGIEKGDKISILFENGKVLLKKSETIHKDFDIKN